MVLKRYNTETSCHIDYACLKFAAGLKMPRRDEVRTSQPVLFHFLCRWTCSRCWKMAMTLGRLGDLLVDHDVAVVLVGDSHYIQPATRLAAELKLPFTLLGDDACALKRAYDLQSAEAPCYGQALLLIDAQGEPLFCSENLKSHLAPDLPELISAINHLPKASSMVSKKRFVDFSSAIFHAKILWSLPIPFTKKPRRVAQSAGNS